MTVSEIPPFGKEFREKYFSFQDGYIPVNHGSYGTPPTAVIEAYQKHILQDIGNPDLYLRYKGLEELENAAKEVAKFVDADPNSLAFVTNATAGVNTVLRSYPFKKGDKIVIHSTVYGACGNTVKFVLNRVGVEIVEVQLDYPMEDDDVVKLFETAFKENGPIKLAMFDAVTSMPGVRIPFERIIDLCREYDVLSLVDGAHSIGLIPYSISQLKPDFYLSNLHKWLGAPRGSAFLYVDPKHHKHIHTFPVSHSYLDDDVELPEELEKTRFVDRFRWTGSQFLASAVSAVDAIKFRNEICGGEEKIREHNHGLAKVASEKVAEMWGTQYLENSTKTLRTSLFNVEIPVDADLLEKIQDFDFFEKMRVYIELEMFKKNTFVPFVRHNGKLWARFSCEVYNELSDYEYAASVLKKEFDLFPQSDLYKELTAK